MGCRAGRQPRQSAVSREDRSGRLRQHVGADDDGMTATKPLRSGRSSSRRTSPAFSAVAAERPELKQASVAVCIMADDAGDSLLITRRARGASRARRTVGAAGRPAGRRRDHRGRRAPRAGRGDRPAASGPDAVLGLLDDYVTRSGYVMTPGRRLGRRRPRASSRAGRRGRPRLPGTAGRSRRRARVPAASPSRTAPVIRLPLFDRFVHAPTAAIIYQFCQVALHGRPQRVAHFEAPLFLWS